MRVAVIGAGAAGLTSAKNLLTNGYEFEVLESQADIGGTWMYTEKVGKDEYGFPIYSAMYAGLRTNLPKEVMAYPDFPVPEQEKSYLTQHEILDYLHLYTKHFNLRPYIKFNRFVTNIKPIEGNKWLVKSTDKISLKEFEKEFDAVMVCNGHYNVPVYPSVKDIEKFKGIQCHSHNYRVPEPFTDKRIVLIGAGPSGIDIVSHIAEVAQKVYFSHHFNELKNIYSDNVVLKPDVKCVLNETQIEFTDGSVEDVDVLLYCTGYKYSFPFLDQSCGITVIKNHVEPLYKHIINIKFPTMALIGIPFNVCPFQMFDLQARYFISYLNGTLNLPSTEEMIEETENDLKRRLAKGQTKAKAHLMGDEQNEYYEELSKSANLKTIPNVMAKMYDDSVGQLMCDLENFRENKYTIIDDENFVRYK